MGDEYSTSDNVRLDKLAVARFAEQLGSLENYEVLRVHEDRILLRFRSAEKRSTWAEDVELRFNNRIHVIVHSGTRAQRTDLIAALKKLLETNYPKLKFEEL